jgi:hypothetical protein
MRAVVTILLSLGLLGLATGCSEERPDRAVTVEGGESTSADSEEENHAPEATAGDPLTEAQIKAALLTVQDMPTGWAGQKPEPEGDDNDVIEPQECQAALDAIEDMTGGKPKAKGNAAFNKGGPFGVTIEQGIESYADEIPDGALQKVAATFSKCPEFTSTDAEGTKTEFTVSALSFPNLGDQTLALSLVGTSEGFTVYLNAVSVVMGHNTVGIVGGGLVGMNAEELETITRKAVEKVEKVARS